MRGLPPPTVHLVPSHTQPCPRLQMITMTMTMVLVIMVMVIVLYAVMPNPVPVCNDNYYDDSDDNRVDGDGIG